MERRKFLAAMGLGVPAAALAVVGAAERKLPEVWEVDIRRGRESVGYHMARTTKAYLDGNEVPWCVAADSRHGCVAVIARDKSGQPIHRNTPPTDPELHSPDRDGRGYVLLEIRFGDVELRTHPWPDLRV